MTNRLAGISQVTIAGTSYPLVGKLTWSTGTVTRETMIGQDQVHGYKEMPRTPFISMTLRDAYGMSVTSFNEMTNEVVNCALANSKLIVGQGMWTVEAQEVDSEEATFEVRFEGPTGAVTEN